MTNKDLRFEAMVLQGLSHLCVRINDLAAGRNNPDAQSTRARELVIWNNTFAHLAEDSSNTGEPSQLSVPPAFLFEQPVENMD